jgi:Alpha-glutamyl/putrescinyl thymine pyrophosphorylase clade 2
VDTGDIDPTYYAFRGIRQDLGEKDVKKMLVSMLMFYDIGVSCQLTEVPDDAYWCKVEKIYPDCRRGSERRHFRGENGKKSIASIKPFGSPDKFWDAMYAKDYLTIRENFANISGFGDYFIWKYADYCDRVFDMPVDMSGAIKFLPGEPRDGSKIIANEMGLKDENNFEATIDYCLSEARGIGLKAPPAFERPIGLLEIETAYCMYKHAVTGNDYVGNDILNKHLVLSKVDSKLAKTLIKYLPPILHRYYFPQTKKMEPVADLFSF